MRTGRAPPSPADRIEYRLGETALVLKHDPREFPVIVAALEAAGAPGELVLVDGETGVILRRQRLGPDPTHE